MQEVAPTWITTSYHRMDYHEARIVIQDIKETQLLRVDCTDAEDVQDTSEHFVR